jgi:hypothetical protein
MRFAMITWQIAARQIGVKPSKKGERQPALGNDTLFPLEAFMDSRIPGFSPEEQSEVREVTRRMLAIFRSSVQLTMP